MAQPKTLVVSSLAISLVATDVNISRELHKSKKWVSWNSELTEESKDYYQSIYYGNFYHQAFTASGKDTAFRRMAYTEDLSGQKLTLKNLELAIKSVEVFSEKTGFNLFTFHFSLSEDIEMKELIEVMLSIRNPDQKYQYGKLDICLYDFLRSIGCLHTPIAKPSHLYTFQNLEYKNNYTAQELTKDCYQLANFIPDANESRFQNTDRYTKKQHEEFGIQIYSNWYALSLNDSFVRLSLPDSDVYKRWDLDFFTIYIYNVCLKNYLSYVNSQLAHVTGLSGKMEKKKNEFIEFLNDTQYHRISSKFLPNELFEIISHSLGIKEEMQILEKKIERMNNYFEAKRTRAFNTALIIITFLSVFSVIYDLSMWFEKIEFMGSYLWPIGSLITAGSITLFILAFYIFRLRR